MKGTTWSRMKKFQSYKKLFAIGLTFLAVISPLFIDGNFGSDTEDDDGSFGLASWLPLILFILGVGVLSFHYWDQNLARFDAYWIHRVGGSSAGILTILTILVLVLRFKASLRYMDA